MKQQDVPKFGPLQGVNVLMSANAIAGPAMCGLFGEMGATVTSLERVDFPDVLRMAMTEWFCTEHRNQLSISADIRTKKGKEILKKLIARNDIFVENNKAGVLPRLGVTDEWIWSINPKMVIVRVSGFGQTGDPKYIRRPALDGIGQAFSGYAAATGLEDTPFVAKPFTGDYITSLFGAVSALAALHRAEITGKGESIDVSMFESLLRVSGNLAPNGFNRNIPVTRNGNRTLKAWGDGIYSCKDGKYVLWMSGNAGAPFNGTCKMVGMEDYDQGPKADPPFSHNPEYGAELEKRMKNLCDTKTADEVADLAQKCGATCIQVMDYQSMLENSHYKARNTIIEWDDPCLGEKMKGVGPVPVFKNNPTKIWRGTPILGQDTVDLLTELGYSAEEINELYEKNIVSYGSQITKNYPDRTERFFQTKEGLRSLDLHP